ncbi:dienelactone hydrolase family protein [Magnetospirillum sp. SS-4]|uniref:dienelactone hydrolase family protein n=1 Tax=Magnetospirillum sp. SS-4 TaxID=2681465 RepID=UPI00137E87A6|nr:dienelactone hydrolase family protein [Magnetospirillum sp. SS-4]CAA7617904.1 putative carboxymethylenebutenolidase [Magnetospirillum sp. SS-4]
MTDRSLLIAILAILAWSSAGLAAEAVDADALRRSAMQAPDLMFPAAPSPLSETTRPGMGIFKPDGPGPFPALVLFHQCAGLGQNGKRPNASMIDWARKAVARGYVALLIDAMGPRDIDTVCYGPRNGLVFARGVKDAFQAADHLRRLDYVDRDRVALAGYSWGAMVGLLASSKGWSEVLGDGRRFRAVVSMYPGCFTLRPPRSPAYETARDDIDRPLLVLMGELDTETPPADCLARLEPLRSAGAPVELHLYPDATHCWDCRQLDGHSRTDVRGNRVDYRYNEEATRDAEERMFEFLGRVMK